MNNNNIEITAKTELPYEKFDNFIMAPTLHRNTPSLTELMQSNQQYAIDNAILYKKLLDIENEIKSLKNMVNNLHYPRPTYYPEQPFTNNIVKPISISSFYPYNRS